MRKKLFHENPQLLEFVSEAKEIILNNFTRGEQINPLDYEEYSGEKSLIEEFSMDSAVLEKFSIDEINAIEEFIIKMVNEELEIMNYSKEIKK